MQKVYYDFSLRKKIEKNFLNKLKKNKDLQKNWRHFVLFIM